MTISVVMTTYNGSTFIQEQLESILSQTRKPEEVIICDDCSNDNTKIIVEQFIKLNDLGENWKLFKNQEKKGVTRNFLEGVERAAGDIIFFCDQDDIWENDKIQLMEECFIEKPNMLACSCLVKYIDFKGNEISNRFECLSNGFMRQKGLKKVSLQDAVKYNRSPGLCLAVKKALVKEIHPMIIENELKHDLPIGTVAAIHNGYYVLNRKLVNYRLHSNNTSIPRFTIKSRLSSVDDQIKGRQCRLNQMRAILSKYYYDIPEKDANNLQKAISQTEKSIENMIDRNNIMLFFAIFGNNPMMNRWIAVNNFLVSIENRKKEA